MIYPGQRCRGRHHHPPAAAQLITELKSAELALRLSEMKLRALLESASEGIVATDGDGKILLVNNMSQQLFGYSREELLGQPVEILFNGGSSRPSPRP